MMISKKIVTTKKIFLLNLLFLFTMLAFGQKRTPIIENISKYIINQSDTIKIQRLNKEERGKLREIGYNSYSQSLLVAVLNVESYLDSKSRGEKPDYDSLEFCLNELNKCANEYNVYFNLENYKKENLYYKNYPLNDGQRKNIKEILKNIDLEYEKRINDIATKIINDSIYVIQKTKNDSLEVIKRKQVILKQNLINVKLRKYQINQQKISKIKNEKIKTQRKEDIINKYGLIDGEAIISHKVKIGWTKSMCLSSWGNPYDINRTTTKYGSHEQYVYSLKRYLYFDNGILTSFQD